VKIQALRAAYDEHRTQKIRDALSANLFRLNMQNSTWIFIRSNLRTILRKQIEANAEIASIKLGFRRWPLPSRSCIIALHISAQGRLPDARLHDVLPVPKSRAILGRHRNSARFERQIRTRQTHRTFKSGSHYSLRCFLSRKLRLIPQTTRDNDPLVTFSFFARNRCSRSRSSKRAASSTRYVAMI